MKLRGWKQVGPSVWDHTSGVRIHAAGLVRMVSGQVVYGNKWPESRYLDRAIRINGGNRKRGVMAWALIRWGGLTDTKEKFPGFEVPIHSEK